MGKLIHAGKDSAGKWHLGRTMCNKPMGRWSDISDCPTKITCKTCVKRVSDGYRVGVWLYIPGGGSEGRPAHVLQGSAQYASPFDYPEFGTVLTVMVRAVDGSMWREKIASSVKGVYPEGLHELKDAINDVANPNGYPVVGRQLAAV